jgi:hypothetical protein
MADWPESGRRGRLAELVRRRAVAERERAIRSELAARRETRPEIAASLEGLARAYRDAADFYARQADRLQSQADRAARRAEAAGPPTVAPEPEAPDALALRAANGRRAVPQLPGPPHRPGAPARLRVVPPAPG